MKPFRIAIVGSRGYPRLAFVAAKVDEYASHSRPDRPIVIVSGTEPRGPWPSCRDVDSVAVARARELGLDTIVHEAAWADLSHPDGAIRLRKDGSAYDARAGLRRNSRIVGDADRVVAFWDGESRGTADTIRKAIGCGKELGVYDAGGNLMTTDQVAECLSRENPKADPSHGPIPT
jgi:hypothetical protein